MSGEQGEAKDFSNRDQEMMRVHRAEAKPAPARPTTQVDMFFRDLHAKREEIRETGRNVEQAALDHGPYALIDFFRASYEDQIFSPHGDKKKIFELKLMEDASAELATRRPVSPEKLNLMRDYVTEERQTLEDVVDSDDASEEEKAAAKANIPVLNSFLDRLHNPIDVETEKAGVDAVEAFANSQMVNSDEANPTTEEQRENPDFAPILTLVQRIATDHEATKSDDVGYKQQTELIKSAKAAATELARNGVVDPNDRFSLLKLLQSHRITLLDQPGKTKKDSAAVLKMMKKLYPESEASEPEASKEKKKKKKKAKKKK